MALFFAYYEVPALHRMQIVRKKQRNIIDNCIIIRTANKLVI